MDSAEPVINTSVADLVGWSFDEVMTVNESALDYATARYRRESVRPVDPLAGFQSTL